jgi:polyhydroxybutyrate depolymerase
MTSAAIITPTEFQKTRTEERTMIYDGGERTYFLRVPLGLDPIQPAPVILIFHGMGDTPQTMYKAGFGPVSDLENVVLVYPDLVSHTSTDFLEQLLIDLKGIVKIDPARIYAMGFSLGGKLTYHAACEMSDTIAAFAAVGGMAVCEGSHTSERAVSILHIHGLGDELVPYDTGSFGMPPVEETIAYWAEFNHCEDPPLVEVSDTITHMSYSQCRDGADIELYTIEALGHKVPTKELPAAKIIWDFFESHPKLE